MSVPKFHDWASAIFEEWKSLSFDSTETEPSAYGSQTALPMSRRRLSRFKRRRDHASLIHMDRHDGQDTELYPVHPVHRCYFVLYISEQRIDHWVSKDQISC